MEFAGLGARVRAMLFQILLFIHVVAVVAWVGGAIMHLALMGLARRDDDPGQQVKLIQLDGRLAPVLYIPGSLTVLITGVAMILTSGISWGEPWISIGLVVWVAAFLLGILFYVPQGRSSRRPSKPATPARQRSSSAWRLSSAVPWAEIPVFLFVIFAMTTKFAF